MFVILLLLLGVFPGEEESLFAPTPMPVVARMLELAKVTKDDVVWDLGCGDGRIPILASKKYKCKSFGVDIDRKIADHAASLVALNRLEDYVTIYYGNVLETDFSNATVITIYLMPFLSRRLIPALERLPAGTRIVAHDKPIPGWRKPTRVVRMRLRRKDGKREDHTIYLWVLSN